MAAVITAPYYAPAPRPTERPRHLRPVPDRPTGRSTGPSRPSAAVIRRRRVIAGLVGLLVALVVVLTSIAALRVVSGIGHADAPATTTAAGAPTGVAPSSTYVVQAGDTLWAIAGRLDQGGDVRAVVDALVERTGGADVRPGQVINLDGLG